MEYILQCSVIVVRHNRYDEFLFFDLTKHPTHYKIMVPGLRGQAGGLCKCEDTVGWGLK